ncbi:unnamed protein product [Enterobius vermicularis]|uniref:Lysophospholipid acyltransferase 5 n=1 Tax=Enterobius vermicularis TaxID=51028 RepID=A0A0N4VL28_ENTVE|nr:unnamed protein product [Enterobius vermicularis]
MGLVTKLAETFNANEDALRLLLTILAGYPLAVFYRFFIYNKSPIAQKVFFVIVGISLYFFNCGLNSCHAGISIVFAYLITNYLPGTTASIVLAYFVFLGHLLLGYWFAESDHYDITWTTPFCIMTLRFIALVMDVYDGQKPEEQLKPDQRITRVVNPPDLLETAAYGLCFCGTFVGPQFPLRRFRDFINGEYLNEKKEVRSTGLMPSLGRYVAATFFAVIHQWGNLWIPGSYFSTSHFLQQPYIWKLIWCVIWFRLIMARYVSCWLYTEGAAILMGIAYNGKDKKGVDQWDGVRDVHILRYELGTDFQSVIDSFNVGTNRFAKNYVFRRLRWLGSRTRSHLVTLFFLALWHGYHLGYFVLFLFEFACVVAQNNFYEILNRIPGAPALLAQPWMYPLKLLFGRIVINVCMGVGFLTFGLVKTRHWLTVIFSAYSGFELRIFSQFGSNYSS